MGEGTKMATQATATILGDLRALIEAMLDGQHNYAWGRSKILNEAINCTADDGLPTRGEVAALLAELLAHELERVMGKPTFRQH
jgi:hypothetical protein